jgi:MarR family transcriptional regulator, lower aerobic nicotinate degradation pathway regulator
MGKAVMSIQSSKDDSHAVLPRTVSADADPPWHSVPTAIARRFHQICVAKTSEVVGPSGLTPLQYGVLIHLSRLTGKPEIDQNALAERINVDRNTASLLVEQLAKKGLVERHVNAADRRARLLRLTEQGEKLYARLRPAHLIANESILAPIAPRERTLLIGLLIRVIEANLVRQVDAAQRKRGSRRPTSNKT